MNILIYITFYASMTVTVGEKSESKDMQDMNISNYNNFCQVAFKFGHIY